MSTLADEQRPDPSRVLDQVHASRIEVVQLCGEKGIALYSFLLTHSTREPGHMAVFSLHRLRDDVAEQLGWSPDTVKRYVAVFRALGLVSHYHDQRHQGKLVLPLGLYTPLSNFSALDDLLGKRTKLRQLALKIKSRYVARFGDPSQAHSEEMRQSMQQVKAILEDEHLDPLKQERLQMRIADILTRLARVGDPNSLQGTNLERPDMGDSKTVGEVPCPSQETVCKEDSKVSQGDPTRQKLLPSEHASRKTGDPKILQGDLITSAGTSEPTNTRQMGDSNALQGDPISQDSTQQLRKDTPVGDLSASQGDLIDLTASLSSAKTRQMGDSNALQGDSTNQDLPQQSRENISGGDLNVSQGDLTDLTGSLSSAKTRQMGDSTILLGDPTGREAVEKSHEDRSGGDLNQRAGDPAAEQSTEQDQMGDPNQQRQLKKGDSAQQASPTYNVNYLISNITNNVIRSRKHDDVKRNEKNEEIAKFLSSVLEKYEYEGGKPTFRKYIAAFKHYTPEVIGRAFLVTMVLLHQKRWPIRNCGATFTSQCKTLSGDTDHPFRYYTLDDVEEWLRTWGDLPYAELIATLAAPAPEPAKPEPAPLVKKPSGRPGSFFAPNANKKKRTYGVHYTGHPSTPDLIGPTPPAGNS